MLSLFVFHSSFADPRGAQQFRQAIETRLTTVVNAIAPVYPAVKGDREWNPLFTKGN